MNVLYMKHSQLETSHHSEIMIDPMSKVTRPALRNRFEIATKSSSRDSIATQAVAKSQCQCSTACFAPVTSMLHISLMKHAS